MRVRLIRKLADEVDGIDLRACAVGDVLDLPSLEAGLLIAEEWAVPDRRGDRRPLQRSQRRPGSDVIPAAGSPVSPPCPHCGSERVKVALATRGLVYHRCLQCHESWTRPDRRQRRDEVHHPERRRTG